METRFILPATIATALHALVFLAPREARPPTDDAIADPAIRAFVLPPDEPERVINVTEATERPDKGSPDIRRPQQDEPPAKVIPDKSITQRIQPVTRIEIDSNRILPVVPGVVDGDGDGSLAGIRVLDSRLLDSPPRTRSQVSPFYPAELKSLGVTGEVVVEFVVDEAGRVLDPQVVHSTNAGFEEATLRAVARWRFEPGKKDGRPVRFRMAVPVEFDLGE